MSADVSFPNIIYPSARVSGSPAAAVHSWQMSTMPFMTQRYALPIHHAAPHSGYNDAAYGNGHLASRNENTLRRKTPNGTLNAGYDSTGGEPLQPHKHQLLLSESIASRPVHAAAPVTKHNFLQHRHQQLLQNSNVGPWGPPRSPAWSHGTQYQQSQSPFPVMDCMLNQLPANYNMQQYYGQTVPSVMQPPFQYLGPTASGGPGSGLYGPYWYDGTFSPYRPAALRDPRFYHHNKPGYADTLPSPQLAYQGNMWQQRQQEQQSAQIPWAGTSGPKPFAPPPPNYAGHQSSSRGLGYGKPSSFGSSGPPPSTMNQDFSSGWLDDETSVKAEFGPLSQNGQQRDKVFQWALHQYRDLLGYIHHSRRQQQQTRQAHGQQQVPHRPSFYPKPPRPSASGSVLPSARPKSESTVNHEQDGPAQGEMTHDLGAHDSSTPKARPTSTDDVLVSGNGVQYHASDDQHAAMLQERNRHQHLQHSRLHPLHAMHQHRDGQRTLRHLRGSSIAGTNSLIPMASVSYSPGPSPPRCAQRALDVLSDFCSETDWQWTDGTHLAGCLAYGLSDYEKACKLFTQVLGNDQKHLEARSNLAATLLALDRRREAEEHWQNVVKVAPNHFEAVEHLVGLLCTDQRGKEAIEVIERVENALRLDGKTIEESNKHIDTASECSDSTASRCSELSGHSDNIVYDYHHDNNFATTMCGHDLPGHSEPGFGTSGYAIPGSDNGRMLALAHAKGNLLYGRGDNGGAARAFENAVRIALGDQKQTVTSLINRILKKIESHPCDGSKSINTHGQPILLSPKDALLVAQQCFPRTGELPGLQHVHGITDSMQRRQGVSTTSNSLLSLAKIYQDAMSNASRSAGISPLKHGVRDILALYYFSLSLQPSPSTANNIGILLASVQPQQGNPESVAGDVKDSQIPGVVPGSGIALALQYYNYGLQLDSHHAHLYTNLGSLLKDIGQLDAAINMYERAVTCDGKFDIALANLANAVKDKGRISDAIKYYRRAVQVNPDFAEAVCGLANALNSVCGWQSRGGVSADGGRRDRWHVDPQGMLLDGRFEHGSSSGWIKRVVDIVEKQLVDGEHWGRGTLSSANLLDIIASITVAEDLGIEERKLRERDLQKSLMNWVGGSEDRSVGDMRWEGARVTRIVERGIKRITWQWYQDRYITEKQRPSSTYNRPRLPSSLLVPGAPTVLPFHTFTCPMSAKQIRQISQRNGLRISVATLRAPWLPKQVYPPPRPPTPNLRVGYVSSDFNNHPLAHLMQSVFGLHDMSRVEAFCYATTASDNSVHRRQIESEAPEFRDASTWPVERLVHQIVRDGIHILVNLNGYTRGARNEVFAARPAPIQMSFMGFAGTLGAEWCDYLLADDTAVPVETLSPHRNKVTLEDKVEDERRADENDSWVYGENLIYCRDTFFCCDHKQSAPDAHEKHITWEQEQRRRWKMRKQLFPQLSDDTIIFGNFNQLYKIDPTTFRTWLRILEQVPNSILWLLRFPDLGESNLLATAKMWAGSSVASRVIFTDVAPKHLHISRARVCDLVLDTAECNAHTTAADVLWSGTPLLTLPRYPYKMCSRMAASILKGALPKTADGNLAAQELIATSEEDYEEKAVALGKALSYNLGSRGLATGRLMELRQMLFEARWTSALFDTRRWVDDLEDAYEEAWRRWVAGEGGDIWLEKIPRKKEGKNKKSMSVM